MSEELDQGVRAELSELERKVAGEVEPGLRGVGIAAAVLVLLAAMLAPHSGSASGWDVLLFDARAQAAGIGLPSRLFVSSAVLFTVAASAAALVLRRWTIAWVATVGCGLTVLLGLFAVWSRQTVPNAASVSGPGLGLLVMWLMTLVVAFHWARLVWTQVPPAAPRAGDQFVPKLRIGE